MAAPRQKQCLATLIRARTKWERKMKEMRRERGREYETENGKEIRNHLHTIITGLVLPSSAVLMYGMRCVGTRSNFASKLV
jgi:hypothetical protein